MKKLVITVLAIPLAMIIANLKADIQHNSSININYAASSAQNAPQGELINKATSIASSDVKAQQTASSAEIWHVSSSPHTKVTADEINTALRVYQEMGMPKQSAAYLIGNFISESYLKPCGQWGDGGKAHGLAQWHPGRRKDMPCDYIDQLRWAVDVEMQRDSPASRSTLFDPNASVERIQQALKRWERWGTLGARWEYSKNIYSQIQHQ